MASKDEKILRKNVNSMKRNKVIAAVIMIILGVVLLIWPNQALGIACRIVGAILCVGGIVAVVMFFVSKEKTAMVTMTMAVGVIIGFIGFWIFLNPNVLASLIPAIIGVYIIISGIINISEAITIHKENGGGAIATLIIALLTIALGVLIFINPKALNAILVRLIGVSLIFDGVSDIWILSKITGKVKEVVADVQSVTGEAVDENGDPVKVRSYAPDESAKAKASQEGAQDAEVKPAKKSFFHKDKKSDVVSESHFGDPPAEDFTETHNYTTTTIKRPAHTQTPDPAPSAEAPQSEPTPASDATSAEADPQPSSGQPDASTAETQQ